MLVSKGPVRRAPHAALLGMWPPEAVVVIRTLTRAVRCAIASFCIKAMGSASASAHGAAIPIYYGAGVHFTGPIRHFYRGEALACLSTRGPADERPDGTRSHFKGLDPPEPFANIDEDKREPQEVDSHARRMRGDGHLALSALPAHFKDRKGRDPPVSLTDYGASGLRLAPLGASGASPIRAFSKGRIPMLELSKRRLTDPPRAEEEAELLDGDGREMGPHGRFYRRRALASESHSCRQQAVLRGAVGVDFRADLDAATEGFRQQEGDPRRGVIPAVWYRAGGRPAVLARAISVTIAPL